MGAGKTTIGKELGRQLSFSVFDTDEVIESVMHQSISELFEKNGEATFRNLETKVIKKLSWNDVVVTTGGGIIKRKENRDWMKQSGVTIYLHCDPEIIMRRLAYDTTRPLLKEKSADEIIALFEERLPYYLEADYTVNTTMKSTSTVIDEIVNFLNMHQKMWA